MKLNQIKKAEKTALQLIKLKGAILLTEKMQEAVKGGGDGGGDRSKPGWIEDESDSI
jgi:hypothetical protein